MDYFCDRCGYTTKYPGRFSIHLNKKNPCKPILKDISIESIKNNFLQNNQKKYYCQNCGYTTDDKSYFNKHINRQNSCMKVTNEVNDIVESDNNTPQFFKKVFDNNFSSNDSSENEENHINIHIVDSEDQIENIDFNLLTKKEEYSNNIEELDAIYNQLLKENNISQEENNSEITTYQEPVIRNEIDIYNNEGADDDILEIDTNNLKSNEEEMNDSQFPDYTFSTSYTDIDSSMETEFKEKMDDYLNLKGDINVINKVNNIVIHCHTRHNLDFLSNEVYTYFSQLEPGTYVLIRDEIPTVC